MQLTMRTESRRQKASSTKNPFYTTSTSLSPLSSTHAHTQLIQIQWHKSQVVLCMHSWHSTPTLNGKTFWSLAKTILTVVNDNDSHLSVMYACWPPSVKHSERQYPHRPHIVAVQPALIELFLSASQRKVCRPLNRKPEMSPFIAWMRPDKFLGCLYRSVVLINEYESNTGSNQVTSTLNTFEYIFRSESQRNAFDASHQQLNEFRINGANSNT